MCLHPAALEWVDSCERTQPPPQQQHCKVKTIYRDARKSLDDVWIFQIGAQKKLKFSTWNKTSYTNVLWRVDLSFRRGNSCRFEWYQHFWDKITFLTTQITNLFNILWSQFNFSFQNFLRIFARQFEKFTHHLRTYAHPCIFSNTPPESITQHRWKKWSSSVKSGRKWNFSTSIYSSLGLSIVFSTVLRNRLRGRIRENI